MLKKILKLYTTAMLNEVTSPTPHLFGPPGCGKSTFCEQAAALLEVNLHVINVSRISPLELEGVQMPDKDNSKLNLLTAIFWTRMQDGDILLLDEFLRGFPEVYNGLLDILTSRQVGGFKLPKVFIIAASNTTVAYDKALEDRLLHLPVPDPRSSKREADHLSKILVETTGMLPSVADSYEMQQVLKSEIFPTYELLDTLKNKATVGTVNLKGHSLRHLIGQVQLREIQSNSLRALVDFNNLQAMRLQKAQYVILTSEIRTVGGYDLDTIKPLEGHPKLTDVQRKNLLVNKQFLELQEIKETEYGPTDALEDFEDFFV